MRSVVTPPNDGRPAQDGEVGVGEHRQGDVPVPAGIRADLVLVEPDFALGLLEATLDSPAPACDPHEIAQRRTGRRVGQVEGRLVRIGKGTAHQKRTLEAGFRAAIGQTGSIVEARPLGAVACAQALPDGRRVLELGLDLISKPLRDRAHRRRRR